MDKKLQYFVDRSKVLKRLGALAKHKDFRLVIQATDFLPSTAFVAQRIWHLQYSIYSIPSCKKCSINTTWHKTKKKYNTYCGTKCARGDILVQEKIEQTNIERYGTKNPQQNIHVRNKTIRTNIERYGTKYVIENEEIRNKIKQTNIERYGIEYTCTLDDVKNKRINTCIDRYGVENPFANTTIQKKIKQTNIERYGTGNFNQKHIPPNTLSLLNNKDWLYDQHITHTKTLTQIADELMINATTVGNYMRLHNINVQLYFSGYICEHYFRVNPQHKLRFASLYIIMLHDDNEQFIKIGITSTSLRQRCYSIPYHISVVLELSMSLYDAYQLEQHILQTYNSYAYVPIQQFSGRTECLDVMSSEMIINELSTIYF